MSERLRNAFDWPVQPLAPGVRLVSTSRIGGLGIGAHATANLGTRSGDDPVTVAANRQRIGRLLGLPTEPAWLQQVHGTGVVEIGAANGTTVEEPVADAAWTGTPDTVCAVLTADCLPVVVAASDGSRVGVAHAGWRSLAAGIVEEMVAAMGTGSFCAWLGPAIGPHRFEVGPEVRDAFLQMGSEADLAFRPGRNNHWFADLYLLARQRLRAAGIQEVLGGGACTFSDARRYFSHRRDGAETGRMATFAWLE